MHNHGLHLEANFNLDLVHHNKRLDYSSSYSSVSSPISVYEVITLSIRYNEVLLSPDFSK